MSDAKLMREMMEGTITDADANRVSSAVESMLNWQPYDQATVASFMIAAACIRTGASLERVLDVVRELHPSAMASIQAMVRN